MIEVERLRRSFGTRAVLRDVSFAVPRGEIAGFLGRNGVGKTTTMRVLTTFLAPDPDSGPVRVAGHDVLAASREVCRKVGYLPESMPIHPELRVVEYLRYRARLKGLGREAMRRRVAAVLDLCDLAAVSRRTLGILSKGFRQRVGLADALLAEPEVLILDEPTSGLDPQQVAEVRGLIERLRESCTVLLSSHVLGEIEQVCDRIVILDEGTVIASEDREAWRRRSERAGSLELLLADPPDEVTAQLRKIPAVESVSEEPCPAGSSSDGGDRRARRFTIVASGDVREAVFRRAVEGGWKLLELTSRPATLESLFLSLVDAKRKGGDA